MDKITFLANLMYRGTAGDIDFGTIELLDDPRNDEFFQTETYEAESFGEKFEKERTKPFSASIKLSNLPKEQNFIYGLVGSGIYRITIEKTDEKPEKRVYEQEEKHITVKDGWHKGSRATCTTCGILTERDGSGTEDTSGNI